MAGFVTKNLKDGTGVTFAQQFRQFTSGAHGSTGVIVDDAGNIMPAGDAAGRAVHMIAESGLIKNPTFAVSASPDYSIGDVVGTAAPYTLTTVNSASGRPVILESLKITDNTGTAPALHILFFNALPTGTYTDNAAFAWGTGDFAKLCGDMIVETGDYETLASKSFINWGRLGQKLEVVGTSLYFIVVARGTYNAAASTDLAITMGFNQE